MSQFFAQLARDMTGDSSGAGIDDALTVLAAFVRVTSPLTPGRLAAALGWPLERVVNALRVAGSDRLTTAQREALDR
jgi:hypothetical protein